MSDKWRIIQNTMTDLSLGDATLDSVLDALQDLHRLRIVYPVSFEREQAARNRLEILEPEIEGLRLALAREKERRDDAEQRAQAIKEIHDTEYAPHIEALQAMQLAGPGGNVLAAAVAKLRETDTSNSSLTSEGGKT